MTGKNIGDLLSAKNLTWGWFEGGFDNWTRTHTGICLLFNVEFRRYNNIPADRNLS
jgi:hypothetical protein